ncbi:hypothetical protein B0O80DRAFT_445483 [Mortierella sp. GBAus27b]|nr:hypothetical protein B0O80DRAFT_445483 [Mortierella sp. GBAus27b]
MTTVKRLAKAKVGSAIGCIDIGIEIVATGIVGRGEQVTWQCRAAGDRVESIVGCSSCQAVAVLERVEWLAVVDVVAADANRGWRQSCSRVCSVGRSLIIRQSTASVEVLLGHFSLEQRTLLCVHSTPIEHCNSLQGFLLGTELCKANLYASPNSAEKRVIHFLVSCLSALLSLLHSVCVCPCVLCVRLPAALLLAVLQL